MPVDQTKCSNNCDDTPCQCGHLRGVHYSNAANETCCLRGCACAEFTPRSTAPAPNAAPNFTTGATVLVHTAPAQPQAAGPLRWALRDYHAWQMLLATMHNALEDEERDLHVFLLRELAVVCAHHKRTNAERAVRWALRELGEPA